MVSELVNSISPAGNSAAEQLRIISSQQANKSGSVAKQPSQQVPVQLRPNIQQQINQSSNQAVHQSLHQQVQQVMQQPPASSQPMQALIQYVQAPRMSAPIPVPQLINHHPYTLPTGRVVGTGGLRIVRP